MCVPLQVFYVRRARAGSDHYCLTGSGSEKGEESHVCSRITSTGAAKRCQQLATLIMQQYASSSFARATASCGEPRARARMPSCGRAHELPHQALLHRRIPTAMRACALLQAAAAGGGQGECTHAHERQTCLASRARLRPVFVRRCTAADCRPCACHECRSSHSGRKSYREGLARVRASYDAEHSSLDNCLPVEGALLCTPSWRHVHSVSIDARAQRPRAYTSTVSPDFCLHFEEKNFRQTMSVRAKRNATRTRPIGDKVRRLQKGVVGVT